MSVGPYECGCVLGIAPLVRATCVRSLQFRASLGVLRHFRSISTYWLGGSVTLPAPLRVMMPGAADWATQCHGLQSRPVLLHHGAV